MSPGTPGMRRKSATPRLVAGPDAHCMVVPPPLVAATKVSVLKLQEIVTPTCKVWDSTAAASEVIVGHGHVRCGS
jgi:hypothetical protein